MNTTFRKLTLVCCVGAMLISVANAQDTILPAEKIFEAKVAKAKAEFDAASKKARDELKVDLEKAKVEATKAGNLDKAILIRDRQSKVDELGPDEASMTPSAGLAGRYEFRYSNNARREYVFSRDNSVVFVTADGKPYNTDDPKNKTNVYWFKAKEKDDVVGFIYWPSVPYIERVVVSKNGIISLIHFARFPETAEGRKSK